MSSCLDYKSKELIELAKEVGVESTPAFADKVGTLMDILQMEDESTLPTPEQYNQYISDNKPKVAGKVIQPQGLLYAEILIPALWKELFDDPYFIDKKTGDIDFNKVNDMLPEIMNMLGYRIPNEDKYSTLPMKAIGFLPTSSGGGIMFPAEVTTIDGSDMDVDKRYMIIKKLVKSKGKLQVEKYLDDKNSTTEERKLAYAGRTDKGKAIKNEYKGQIKDIGVEIKKLTRLSIDEIGEELDFLESDLSDVKNDLVKDLQLDGKAVTKEEYIDELNKEIADLYKQLNVLNNKSTNEVELESVKEVVELRNKRSQLIAERDSKILETISDEEFNKIPIPQQNTKGARDNEKLDVLMGIYQNPYTAKDIMTPGGYGSIAAIAKEFNGDIKPPKDIFGVEAMDNMTIQNIQGRDLKGIAANHNSHASKRQWSNLKLSFPALFDGQKLDSLHDKIAHSVSGEKRTITRNFAEILAASVDNGKDPLLASINYNQHTADVISLLIATGADLKTVFAFINQPVIKQAVELVNLGEQRDLMSALKSIAKERKISTKEVDLKITNFNQADLLSTLKGDKNISNEANILQSMIKYMAASKDFSNLIAASKSDTKGIGKFMEEGITLMRNIKKALTLKTITGTQEFLLNEGNGNQNIISNTVIENKNTIDYSDYTNYSGAADGGDTIWESIGKENGLGNQVNYVPADLKRLSKEQLEEVDIAYKKAVIDLGRKELAANTFAGGLVRRDYLQAKAADAIFAVSTIIEPGQKDKKGYYNKTNHQTVEGGTGYAVQMAINMNKPVYVFDQLKNSWFTWNGSNFIEIEQPKLTKKFAGIGTREINENGRIAIENIYKGNKIVKNSIVNNSIEKSIDQRFNNMFYKYGVELPINEIMSKIYPYINESFSGIKDVIEQNLGYSMTADEARLVDSMLVQFHSSKFDWYANENKFSIVKGLPAVLQMLKNDYLEFTQSDEVKPLFDALTVGTDDRFGMDIIEFDNTQTASDEQRTDIKKAWQSLSNPYAEQLLTERLLKDNLLTPEELVTLQLDGKSFNNLKAIQGLKKLDKFNNPEVQKLIQDYILDRFSNNLIRYSFYTTGLNFTPKSISSLIPIGMYTDVSYNGTSMSDMVYGIQNMPNAGTNEVETIDGITTEVADNSEASRFIDQFYKHMAGNPKFVPKAKFDVNDTNGKNNITSIDEKVITIVRKGDDTIGGDLYTIDKDGYMVPVSKYISIRVDGKDMLYRNVNSSSNTQLVFNRVNTLGANGLIYEFDNNGGDISIIPGNNVDLSTNKTERGNVYIYPNNGNGIDYASMQKYALDNDMIYSLRMSGFKHYGNPFGVSEATNTIKNFKTVAEAVKAYKDWILTNKYDSEFPQLLPQKRFILEAIKSGELKGKKILYYKELGETSHANILDELINGYDIKIDENNNVSFKENEELINKCRISR